MRDFSLFHGRSKTLMATVGSILAALIIGVLARGLGGDEAACRTTELSSSMAIVAENADSCDLFGGRSSSSSEVDRSIPTEPRSETPGEAEPPATDREGSDSPGSDSLGSDGAEDESSDDDLGVWAGVTTSPGPSSFRELTPGPSSVRSGPLAPETDQN